MTTLTCGHPTACRILHDCEYVCGRCGVVDKEATEQLQYSLTVDAERASSATDHQPVNHILRVSMGSQHDYISPANKGLCMKLNDARAKDFQGKKVVPQLSMPYVTGQVVGKGSVVVDEEDGRIRARKEFLNDTIYFKANTKVNKLAKEKQLDVVTLDYLGKELIKEFSKIANIVDEFLALKAYLMLARNYEGLGLNVPDEVVDAYNQACQKLRQFTQEPMQKQSQDKLLTA